MEARSRRSMRLMRGEERVDRTKQLPRSIRLHILSLLTIEEVAKMIFVPPLRDAWTRIPNHTFEQNEFHDNNIGIPDAPHYNVRFVKFIKKC